MKTIRDLGEFGLIRQLSRNIPRAGDDCAVLPGGWLFTCDPVVEGIHFLPATTARRVGWKAMARNLSDIAAMGGQPRWAVVSIGLRPDTSVRWVRELYGGLHSAARRFGAEIVGGDTTHVKHEQFVVVTLLGHSNRPVLRTGSKIGDSVFVTGTLGAGQHLTFIPRVKEAQWLVRHFNIHAMIDLSDGLASDAEHLGVGIDIDAAEIPGKLPAALTRGEDFELLFTIDPRDVTALRTQWKFRVKLTEIGRVVRGKGVRLDGQPLAAKGYDHFPKRR
jgi:thiamine-monophosphate kinase